ncbi:hypothetical protein LTR94_026367, partial [Friedmanniomyces endolithicus]
VIGSRSRVEAGRATIQRIEADINDSSLRAPRDGRVQYRVAQPGEVVTAGGRVLSLVDLSDVTISFFLPATAAGRVAIGSEARIVLDAIPDYPIPARISFVADVAQFTPKTVETQSEREKMMFRVKARIDPALLRKHIAQVKTGLPGMAYVRIDPGVAWPASLAADLIGAPTVDPVVRLSGVRLHYGKTQALRGIDLDIPGGRMIGLIGPDGVGKSSLLSLVAGAHVIQDGDVHVLGGDMRDKRHRSDVCPRIAYMPQGLGKNLYPTLSVEENLQFFGRLFGHDGAERRRRIDALTRATGLDPFHARPAGKLSGGMKQKLGLCCALIHDPDLLILDEPTTGVDPLARAQFWDLINDIRQTQAQMSVIVATAYMDEAQRFDWLVAMDDGRVLATGSPRALLDQTGEKTLESAFIALLPEEKKQGYEPVRIIQRVAAEDDAIAIEATGLTVRFGDFTAVDHVDLRIAQGEIFGFLGSNGCGKSTTMKVLTGLLPASE